MKPEFITILVFALIIFTFGFAFDIHNSQCAIPDFGGTDLSGCPSICECSSRDVPKCQISECDHFDCISWYGICVYKWR